MPNIDLSGILSTFLSSAQSDGSVTKGLISQPEATVEKATGLSLGNINLKAIIPIAIGLLAAFAMNTGQAKTEKAAETKIEEGALDLSGMNVGNLLGGLDLGALLGGGTAAAAAPAAAAATETASSSVVDALTDTITESVKKQVMESITSQLLGGATTTAAAAPASKSSGVSDIVGDVLSGVVGNLLGKK